MDDFNIVVTETLQRTVTVQAENEEEAIDIVNNMYKTEELVLDSGDFVGYEINVQED